MAIDRTAFNQLVDDDGSGLVGSIWNKTQIKNVLLDPVDAAIVTPGPGTVTLTGGQLLFPATPNPSANGYTLDDYREGLWTPGIGGSTSATGQAYAIQDGRYIKIGRVVIAWFRVKLSTLGTITGSVFITNLPFAAYNNANAPWPGPAYWDLMATAMYSVSFVVNSNTNTAIVLGMSAAGTSAANGVLGQANLTANTELRGTLVYEAAS